MKYVLGAVAVLAAVGTATYFYMQDKDADAAAPVTPAEDVVEPEAAI